MDFPKPQQEAMDEFARVHLKTCIITGGVLREFNLFVTCISTHIIPGTNDYFYSHSRKVLQYVSPNGHTTFSTTSKLCEQVVTCHIVSHPRAPPFISKFISNFISNATNSYCPTTAALDRVSFVRLCATKAPHFWGWVPF